MAHHRYLRVGDRPHRGDPATSTLELHRVSTRPYEDRRIADRVARLEMVGEPRHVTYEQSSRSRACHGSNVVGEILDSDLESVLQAEDQLSETIPDEDDVDIGSVHNAGKGRIIGSDHHDGARSPAALAGADIRYCHFSCHFRTSSRPAPWAAGGQSAVVGS